MVIMEKVELAVGIYMYKNVHLEIEDFYKDMEDAVEVTKLFTWSRAGVSDPHGNEISEGHRVRDTYSISVPYTPPAETGLVSDLALSELSGFFKNAFEPRINQYCVDFGVSLANYDNYNILKYGVGQHFDNHIDDSPAFHRRVSLTYYANDDYTGGEINFPRFNLSIKPEKYDLLIFPSSYVYNHSVNPVIEGTRYAVVQWMN